jgi:hypothetical protein
LRLPKSLAAQKRRATCRGEQVAVGESLTGDRAGEGHGEGDRRCP